MALDGSFHHPLACHSERAAESQNTAEGKTVLVGVGFVLQAIAVHAFLACLSLCGGAEQKHWGPEEMPVCVVQPLALATMEVSEKLFAEGILAAHVLVACVPVGNADWSALAAEPGTWPEPGRA